MGTASRIRALVAIGIPVLSTASCSLLVDTSGLAGSASDLEADGATTDANVDEAGRGDAGPRKNSCGGLLFGTPVPLQNADFELGCSNSWSGYEATIVEETSLVSSGSVACRLCYVGGPDGFFIHRATATPVAVGETYEVVGCVRAAPDAGGTAAYGFVLNAAQNEGVDGTAVPLGSTYAPARATWTVDRPYPGLSIGFRAPTAQGSCFLVDDVTLSKVEN